MLSQHFGAFVEYWSFDFPYETDFTDSLGGSWYVSPTHHAVEILTLAPLYVGLTCWFGYRALYKNTMAYRLLTTNAPRPRRTLTESILLLLLIASFATTVIHKAANNTLLFLMQPCHASAVLLILVMSWPDHKYAMIPRTLFNIYLHTLWGAILALIWPDLRNHDMLGEVSNFFLEHTLVLLLPFYLITTGRYMVVPASLDLALLSFFLYAAYHSPMLHILSLYSGFNLNYVLVPPALKFLIAAGVWYRFIMYMTALIMMFFTRYILVGTWLFLVHGQLKNKKQA